MQKNNQINDRMPNERYFHARLSLTVDSQKLNVFVNYFKTNVEGDRMPFQFDMDRCIIYEVV